MDHAEVVRQKLTESYLLNELDAEVRDQFEEHFFDCAECALDVSAGSQFVAHSKVLLAEDAAEAAKGVAYKMVPVRRGGQGWFAWLRPSFAAPALALLLAVVAYQNFVTYPQLRVALRQPQVLPWASVVVGTWGSGGPTLSVQEGKGFLLFVRIPPDGTYARYVADLYNPAGKLECSLTIPAAAGEDQWPVLVPGSNRETGTYRIAVRGVTAAGESKELGSASLALQILK